MIFGLFTQVSDSGPRGPFLSFKSCPLSQTEAKLKKGHICFTTYSMRLPKIVKLFLARMYESTGPRCSKLTTSLVNVLLNFQKLISQIFC